MAQNQPRRQKHVPQRTCVACRNVAGKRALVRIVRTGERVMIDETGKISGRGAYLHADRSCWAQVLETRRLDQALRTRINPTDRQALAAYMATLPDDSEPTG